MTPERWQRIEEVFAAASLLPSPERGEYVRSICGDDTELSREIASLLESAEGAHAALEQTIRRGAASLCGPATGSRVGPYRILELLGAGGMGTVYLAERDDGEYRRAVAIKVLRAGFASPELIARFRDERQVLAALDHPGIVRFIDAGRTTDDLPYLVMEYIEGTPFAAHSRTLSVRGRVNLVVQIADALQAAHQRLVVHRDVKPSNLLVDPHGCPKLLDFGIAKLLDPDVGREAETRTGAAVFTTEYASPEQVRGDPVSVATDVYSLGAVLYDVLVGEPPQRKGATPLETLHNICDREPPRPSVAVAPELRRDLAGDLDNILLKALAKRPEHRYASMADFAGDLRAYLDGRPVLAREATLGYRARKLLSRHRGKVAVAVTIVSVLTAATILSVAEARRADRQAARAEDERRTLLVEQGRQELATGHAGRALPYLLEGLRADADTPAVRFMIAKAMRPFENRVAAFGDADGFTTATWSPDGSRFAVSSMVSHGELHRADGTLLARFVGDGSYQGTTVFSADGNLLAALDGMGRVMVWDASTGARRLTLAAHPAAPSQDIYLGGVVFFAHDTRLATGGADHRIAIWDVATGQRLAAADVGAAVASLAVSPDGSTLAVATRSGRLTLWDTGTLAQRSVLQELHGDVRLVFSPDGTRLYTGGFDDGTEIWDLARAAVVTTLPGMVFDLDATGTRIATGGNDGPIHIWDASTGALQLELLGHERSIHSIRWSRDGKRLVSSGRDFTFRVWDAVTGDSLMVLEATAGTGNAPHSLPGALSASFSTDGTRVLTLWGVGAALWRADRGALLDERDIGHHLYAAAWSPDERRIATSAIGFAGVWGSAHQSVEIPVEGRLYDANWSPDGTCFVAVGESRTALVLRSDGSPVLSLAGHSGDVYRGSFSPDGTRIATASADHTARIWDATTGVELRRLEHPSSVMAAAWSRDGKRLVTASWDHHLRIWDPATGALEADFDGGKVHYLDVTFSPDRRSLAAAGAGSEVEVWDVTAKRRRLALEGHSANVTAAIFSPDGALIATASSDHTARVWDAATGALLASFPHPNEVMSAQWSHDGTRLLTASHEGVVRIWDVHRSRATTAELDAFAADRVPYRLVDGRLEHLAW